VSWLVFSILASIVLTVVCNVALRLFPDAADRLRDRLFRLADRPGDDPWDRAPRSGMRVIVPWKAMLIGSLVLTIAINLLWHVR
jgi:hypothetical protein